MHAFNPTLEPSAGNAILRRMKNRMLPDEENEEDGQLRALIARMIEGDKAALNSFYSLTLSRVYGLALKVTGRSDISEEVCVETFWQVWREAMHYDSFRGKPIAWLMMIARSRALDALRRLDPVTYCEDPEIYLQAESCPEGSPLDQLLLGETSGVLKRALDLLTPIQRQLVALAFYKDLSQQEISNITGLPLGTVKSHLKRAQDSLRKLLSRA